MSHEPVRPFTGVPAQFDVVGVGENSLDTVYRLPGPLVPNAKLPIIDCRTRPRGQVATTLCTCSALRLRTAYIGTFGDDAAGARVRDALSSRGVNVEYALTRRAPNRQALVLVDERSGDRVVLWRRDAALTLEADALPADIIRRARLVHVDTVDEDAALAAARMARASGVEVTTDIDKVTPRTRELLDIASLPIVAADVPRQLTGEADVERALRLLAAQVPRLCVTLGERGALLLEGGRLHRAPAFRVEAVDTTGAGDVFRGALIYARLRGDAPEDLLRFANAAAAVSCTREGAIEGIPRLGEIEAKLHETIK